MYCTAGSSEQFSEIQFPTMSSPFSSLKKGKSPFLPGHIPGHRPIPFRHPEYSEDESRLLEEITTSMAASRMTDRQTGRQDRDGKNQNAPVALSHTKGL